MRKFIAMVLAMSMMFTMGVNAFATSHESTTTETIYVELENGAVIPVEVTETYVSASNARSSEQTPEAGSAYLYEFYISNEDIEDAIEVSGIVVGAVGTVLAPELVGTVASLAKIAVSKKVKEFAAGVVAGIAVKVFNDIAEERLLCARNDYEIEVGFSYKRVYTNAAGNDVYAWDYSYTNVNRY